MHGHQGNIHVLRKKSEFAIAQAVLAQQLKTHGQRRPDCLIALLRIVVVKGRQTPSFQGSVDVDEGFGERLTIFSDPLAQRGVDEFEEQGPFTQFLNECT